VPKKILVFASILPRTERLRERVDAGIFQRPQAEDRGTSSKRDRKSMKEDRRRWKRSIDKRH